MEQVAAERADVARQLAGTARARHKTEKAFVDAKAAVERTMQSDASAVGPQALRILQQENYLRGELERLGRKEEQLREENRQLREMELLLLRHALSGTLQGVQGTRPALGFRVRAAASLSPQPPRTPRTLPPSTNARFTSSGSGAAGGDGAFGDGDHSDDNKGSGDGDCDNKDGGDHNADSNDNGDGDDAVAATPCQNSAKAKPLVFDRPKDVLSVEAKSCQAPHDRVAVHANTMWFGVLQVTYHKSLNRVDQKWPTLPVAYSARDPTIEAPNTELLPTTGSDFWKPECRICTIMLRSCGCSSASCTPY
jgi:hypothetical protein